MATFDTSLFVPELVFFDIEAENQAELFDCLGNALLEKGYVHPSWREAIATREEAFPTGLATQTVHIAIPHVDPEHIAKAYIAVVRLSQPVSFAHMGGLDEPVHAELIINLGLQQHAEEQVAVLQALMGVFMDEAATAEVLAQNTAEGMVETLQRLCG